MKKSYIIIAVVASIIVVLSSALALPNYMGWTPFNSMPFNPPTNYRSMGMMGGSMVMGNMMNWGTVNSSYYNNCPMSTYYYPPLSKRLSIEEVKSILDAYLTKLNNNFAVKEIMEFQNNFYAIVIEKDTKIGAFELLVNPYSGIISPEPGPNMMWNTKYGMHGYTTSSNMNINPEEAKKLALNYLKQYFSNVQVEEPTQFYGYYTLDFKVNDKIYGMLSVNGYTGQVWYHSWHGEFIQEME